MTIVSPDLLQTLAQHAARADAEPVWPADSWNVLVRAGVPGWCIPPEHGGQGRSGPELLDGYEALAGACLTTCFLLSQRDAACRRLREGDTDRLGRLLLPSLARGATFATVGLSQLTTSRQHGKPSLQARLTDAALVLEGTIPWVTGATAADHLIIGATLDDGRQVLAVLPRNTPGVEIGPPLDLMALEGSLTAEVRCGEVVLDRQWILAGPTEKVMAGSRGGTGGLETSCLGLGLAGAAIRYLLEEGRSRPELLAPADRLQQMQQKVREDLHRLAREGSTPDSAGAVRTHANKLVLRSTQAALTAAKGTGYLRSHPAQRWARQALFFLVWSCPGPVARATMASLACEGEETWG